MTSPIRKAVPHTMTGILIGCDGRYNLVSCADAPDHLKTLHLAPSQCGGAKFGDRVELVYTVTPRSGLWSVSKVLGSS